MLRRFKSNNHRRLTQKKSHKKINLRRQYFYNREVLSQLLSSDTASSDESNSA